jgi:nitroreductase
VEFRDVVRHRRMVRNYTDDEVDRESIDRILAAALNAPSAGFTQGQSFVVVTDRATRAAIAELAGEPRYVASGFDPWISTAPVHIVVNVSEEAYHRRYRESDKVRDDGTEIAWPVPYWWVDAGASLMLLLLGAVDEGLAAGFLGVHSIPGLQRLLDLPDDVLPIGVVTVGHPARDHRSASLQRGRRPLQDVIHRERW